MDKFQSGLLAISSATLLIFIIYTLVNEKKSSKWFKWYNQMDSEEQKKYNPIIAVHKLKRALFFNSIGWNFWILNIILYSINFRGCICFNFYYPSCFYRIFGTKRV